MKNSENAEYLGGVHHSGIGKTTALVSREILEKKKICIEIKKIEEKYLDKEASYPLLNPFTS
jgi:hypothetical protein